MIGIAFDVHHLRDGVLRLIAERVNDHAATYRAVRTGAARFGRSRDLQALRLRINRSEVESKNRDTGAADQAGLNEGSS